MLLNVLTAEGEASQKILLVLVMILALLPAFTFHEWAHGFAAYKLGDPTAKYDSRLSLNPIDHIDPVGAILLLIFGFGWAKPVPVNIRNLKNPKRDFAICSAAGPLMNLLLAFVSAVICGFASVLCYKLGASDATRDIIVNLFFYSTSFNVSLAMFNLIPLPPLDGSNIVVAFLPNTLAAKYLQLRYYTRYIFLALFILSRTGIFSGVLDIVFFPINYTTDLFIDLINAVARFAFDLLF